MPKAKGGANRPKMNKISYGLLGGLIAALVIATVFITLFAVDRHYRKQKDRDMDAAIALSKHEVETASSKPRETNFVRAKFRDTAYEGVLTVSHPYYETPRGLVTLLDSYTVLARAYPEGASRIVVQIVDDGSPSSPALPIVRRALPNLAGFREVRVVTLTEDAGFNKAGAMNTGALAAPTEALALLDLSVSTPIDPTDIETLLRVARSLRANPTHLFDMSPDPASMEREASSGTAFLVNRDFYLHTGGVDEDFSKGYKYEVNHFLYRFKSLNGGAVVNLTCRGLGRVQGASPSEAMEEEVLTDLKSTNARTLHQKIAAEASPTSFARVPWTLAVFSSHRKDGPGEGEGLQVPKKAAPGLPRPPGTGGRTRPEGPRNAKGEAVGLQDGLVQGVRDLHPLRQDTTEGDSSHVPPNKGLQGKGGCRDPDTEEAGQEVQALHDRT